MRRTPLFAVIALLLASCVTIEPPPNPRGAVKPGQRLIVLVHQAPGPWIVADPDSKAESAMKMLPLGTFLQGVQEERINTLSKEIQPYLPRPRYDQAVEAALIQSLKAAHDGPVQTAAEAGIAPAQRKDWNAASDQLDWRRKYYFTDPSIPSPRDYSKLLSLDDAVVVEVNLSFGLEPDAQDRTLPLLSAAARAYRADTTRMLWSREERLSDTTSSSTLTEFRAAPVELTDRLYVMSVPLAGKIAAGLAQDAGLRPAAPPRRADPPPAPGLLDLSSPAPVAAPSAPPAPVEPEKPQATSPSQ
ncbi:MAG: hypothetical protein NDJ72_02070 [Elusimicrobia bacterium]|nr:hypothetical protein [Elusimicrobiota bacterium]